MHTTENHKVVRHDPQATGGKGRIEIAINVEPALARALDESVYAR